MHRIFGLSLSKLNLYPNDDVDIVFWMLNLKIGMLGYVNVRRSALFTCRLQHDEMETKQDSAAVVWMILIELLRSADVHMHTAEKEKLRGIHPTQFMMLLLTVLPGTTGTTVKDAAAWFEREMVGSVVPSNVVLAPITVSPIPVVPCPLLLK